MQFGSLQGHHIIQSTEDQDGYNDGKICYQGATLGEKQKQPEASWGESGKYNMDEDTVRSVPENTEAGVFT